MQSGKRAKPERIAPFLVLAALLLASCSSRVAGGSFTDKLVELDTLLAGRTTNGRIPSDFAELYGLARNTTQWLSLAKRSPAAERLGDSHRASLTADAALRSFRSNEQVAATAAWLYLRDGESSRALSLFPMPLSPDGWPDIWAEARLRTIGARPVSDQAECRRLAVASGDPSWYLEAALLAMRAGDRFSAQAWLRQSLVAGARPDAALLWDAGLTSELSEVVGPGSSAADLELGADAAWIEGDRQHAGEFWAAAQRASAVPSWRTAAALAILQSGGDAAISAARNLASDFKSEPDALRYAAALLIREGDADEAAGFAADLERSFRFLPEALGAELDARKGNEGRFVARAIRLAEEHPDLPAAREFALRVLFAHGRWDEYLILYDGASDSDSKDPGWWFWAVTAKLLRGDAAGAAGIADNQGASPGAASGPEGAFAQGLLGSLQGKTAEAEERFRAALDLATRPAQRCAALKEIGKLEEASGHAERARAAWTAAFEADPDDPEARILASGGGR